MGGPGSGRPWGSGKLTVEDCLRLDVNKLARERILIPMSQNTGTLTWTSTATEEAVLQCLYELKTPSPFSSWIRLVYTPAGIDEKVDYWIRLTLTRPYFGGYRWWFECPLKDCNRRVAKLQLPPGGKYFGCRHCYGLTYTSCQESHKWDEVYARIAGQTGMSPAEAKWALEERAKDRLL